MGTVATPDAMRGTIMTTPPSLARTLEKLEDTEPSRFEGKDQS